MEQLLPHTYLQDAKGAAISDLVDLLVLRAATVGHRLKNVNATTLQAKGGWFWMDDDKNAHCIVADSDQVVSFRFNESAPQLLNPFNLEKCQVQCVMANKPMKLDLKAQFVDMRVSFPTLNSIWQLPGCPIEQLAVPSSAASAATSGGPPTGGRSAKKAKVDNTEKISSALRARMQASPAPAETPR